MIEALSQGLSGHGRKNGPKRWGGNTFVQVLDPDFFAGRRRTTSITRSSVSSPPSVSSGATQ